MQQSYDRSSALFTGAEISRRRRRVSCSIAERGKSGALSGLGWNQGDLPGIGGPGVGDFSQFGNQGLRCGR